MALYFAKEELIMEIKDIFHALDKIGSMTFSTINGDYPESRIAHFFTYDDDGLYFLTMTTKPFYKQLKETKKLSACGLHANSKIEWVEEGVCYSAPGYFIRVCGDVREFSIEEAKAKNDSRFTYLIEDNVKYPQITGFCLYNFHGEIYDYDFDKEHRDHKLERVRFTFGNMNHVKAGLSIDPSSCIGCGECANVCTFSAITQKDDAYVIDGQRCDECGNCFTVCPSKSILSKGL